MDDLTRQPLNSLNANRSSEDMDMSRATQIVQGGVRGWDVRRRLRLKLPLHKLPPPPQSDINYSTTEPTENLNMRMGCQLPSTPPYSNSNSSKRDITTTTNKANVQEQARKDELRRASFDARDGQTRFNNFTNYRGIDEVGLLSRYLDQGLRTTKSVVSPATLSSKPLTTEQRSPSGNVYNVEDVERVQAGVRGWDTRRQLKQLQLNIEVELARAQKLNEVNRDEGLALTLQP